jgi:hypothetical protein
MSSRILPEGFDLGGGREACSMACGNSPRIFFFIRTGISRRVPVKSRNYNDFKRQKRVTFAGRVSILVAFVVCGLEYRIPPSPQSPPPDASGGQAGSLPVYGEG